MTLRVHKDLLDCINDSAVVKDFVACNEVRKDIFGKGLNLLCPQTPVIGSTQSIESIGLVILAFKYQSFPVTY